MANFFNWNNDFVQKPINPLTTFATTALIFAPLERIKLILQTAKKSPYIQQPIGTHPKIRSVVKMIWKGEGAKGFFKGASIPLAVSLFSHQLIFGSVATNVNYAVVEEAYVKNKFGDFENQGLKAIYTSITVNSLILHPFNVLRTNHAIQIGHSGKQMGLLRILKEIVVRYGPKGLFKGYLSHYLPLLVTTTCMINF